MDELRLDGRTAIVTGAGGNPSLGRAYAILLAQRGANVVVNDIGSDPEVKGYTDRASAEAVAEEIRGFGGVAVADTHSVASEDGAAALIQTALDRFGGLDILVNNAGVCVKRAFDELESSDFRKQIDVALMGTIWTCRAAWPHMRRNGYGRIVNTTSAALAGYSDLTGYGASKGGVLSLSRALAAEGEALGIKVNALNPGGFTRMVASTLDAGSPVYQTAKEQLPAELVAPVVVFLAHEQCPVSGECIEAVGGRVQRVFLSMTPGFSDRDLTPEIVARRWQEVMAERDSVILAYGTMNEA